MMTIDGQKAESGLSAAIQIISAQMQVIWAIVNTCTAFNATLLAF